jgi:hypothetical protein
MVSSIQSCFGLVKLFPALFSLDTHPIDNMNNLIKYFSLLHHFKLVFWFYSNLTVLSFFVDTLFFFIASSQIILNLTLTFRKRKNIFLRFLDTCNFNCLNKCLISHLIDDLTLALSAKISEADKNKMRLG